MTTHYDLLVSLVLVCSFLLLLSAAAAEEKKTHEKCPPEHFRCGNLGEIHLPFTNTGRQECGLPVRGCENNNPSGDIEVQLGNQRWYTSNMIQQKGSSIFISIHDPEFENLLSSRNCRAFNYSVIPSDSPLMSFHIHNNITFFTCNHTYNGGKIPANMFHYTNCSDCGITIYYSSDSEHDPPPSNDMYQTCSPIQLPIRYESPPSCSDPFKFLVSDFQIEVKLSHFCLDCYARRGQCLLDEENITCAEADEEPPPASTHPNKAKIIDESNVPGHKIVVITGTVSAALVVGVLIIIMYYFRRRFWKKQSKAHQDFEAFLKNHGPFATRRYSYLDIKKITNSFAEKLGQGGYGGVFKGKIDDERLVAVKVLNKSKGNGEEFINEVASISKTSHVNIVTLLGFCFEGSKRALVYEFVSNGSLEKFIYEIDPMTVGKHLNCENLYQIAIGVARGLEYLHRGCNTRIFHFDIKPHNILLDENFCPKISDFGLAKICPNNKSMVSMLTARGTPGYIAPEVFSRYFGEVSYKSDVYSFGMMVLEMVGGRRNINVEVDCSSEMYFPHWIYKRLELNEDLALRNITNESDKERIRKMVIVSMWCIQTYPADRPTMRTVVEMLEGRIETLQIPPKPFLSSPSRSPCHSSTR